MKNKRTY